MSIYIGSFLPLAVIFWEFDVCRSETSEKELVGSLE